MPDDAASRADPRAAIRALDLSPTRRRWCARSSPAPGSTPPAAPAIVARAAELVARGARALVADGDGGVPRRVRPLDRRGRRADVPRRGAAAGARRRDHRRADRRQDRAVELGRASRPLDLEPGQRRDLGAADHRPGARRRPGPPGRGAARPDPPARRAGGAHRRRPGDEADGPRSSCSARPSTRRWTAPAALEAKGYTYSYDMLGEAARTDADAQRYAARLRPRDRARSPPARPATSAPSPGISVKLSALHPRYEWTHRDDGDGGAGAARPRPRARRRPRRHRLQHRRRGGRAARPVARRDRGAARRPPSSPAGTASASSSRPTAAAPGR